MCSRPAQEPAVDGGIAVSNGHSTGNLDAASVEIECPPRGHVAADEKLSAVVEGDQAGGITKARVGIDGQGAGVDDGPAAVGIGVVESEDALACFDQRQ